MSKHSNFDLKIYKRLQSFNNAKTDRNKKNKINLVDYKNEQLEFKLPEGFKENGYLEFSCDEINISFKPESEDYFKKYSKDQLADPMNKLLKNYNIDENEKIEIIAYRTISEVMNTFNFIFIKKIEDYEVFGRFTSPNSSSEKWEAVFEEVVSSLKGIG